MKSGGIILMFGGVLALIGALLFKTTVSTGSILDGPSEVYNLGALQYQEMLFLAGCTAFLSGVVLFAISELLERMERAGTAKAPEPVVITPSTCLWCQRNVFPHKPCSANNERTNRERAPNLQEEACRAAFKKRGLLA